MYIKTVQYTLKLHIVHWNCTMYIITVQCTLKLYNVHWNCTLYIETEQCTLKIVQCTLKLNAAHWNCTFKRCAKMMYSLRMMIRTRIIAVAIRQIFFLLAEILWCSASRRLDRPRSTSSEASAEKVNLLKTEQKFILIF